MASPAVLRKTEARCLSSFHRRCIIIALEEISRDLARALCRVAASFSRDTSGNGWETERRQTAVA